MSKHKCRFCEASFSTFSTLREHVHELHNTEYRLIRRYLGDTEQKLAYDELLAAQGMIGQKEHR